MRLKDLLERAYLLSKSEEDNHALFWLLLEVFNYNNTDYYLNSNNKVEDDVAKKYLDLAKRYIIHKEPVQYLMGYTYFYGRKFIVTKDTLIPRPETEELISRTINYLEKHNKKDKYKILDLATGSGCIGITLANELNADVTISDISERALEIAKKNMILNNSNVNIIKSNWFNNITDKYDLIISNPPYIKESYIVDDIVSKEPYNALYSGIEGLDSYKEILKNIDNYLLDDGMIAFEHGYDQKESLKEIISDNLENVKVIQEKDFSEKDRYTFIFK